MQKKICYKKLFKLMIDRDLKGHDLREKAGISPVSYTHLRRGAGRCPAGYRPRR